jgi:glycosyltransferase involved in cell wall biosynthesis
MRILIVYQAPWDWSFLWNRSQPLAKALSLHADVIYLNHGTQYIKINKIAAYLLSILPNRIRKQILRARNYGSSLGINLKNWIWEDASPNPWLLAVRDREKMDYSKLANYIRQVAPKYSEVWLLSSRPQAQLLESLHPWDKFIIDIEDPWFDLPWGVDETRKCLLSSMKKASIVMANGPNLATEYCSIAQRPVLSLPNGVDASFIDGLKQSNPEPTFYVPRHNQLRAVFTGNINDRLDFRILQRITDVQEYFFYFIGQENIPNKYASLWNTIKNKSNFRWVSQIPHSEIPAVLQHADVLLVPYFSMGHDKMFPAKLFEYAAACKPIISTMDFSGGSIFIPSMNIASDEEAFCRKLAEIHQTNASLSGKTIDNCRRLASENTWDARASEFISVVQSS